LYDKFEEADYQKMQHLERLTKIGFDVSHVKEELIEKYKED